MRKAAYIAFLAILAVALFQYFQILELREDLWSKNANIHLLNRDYEILESNFSVALNELNTTRLKLNQTNIHLNEKEASLQDAMGTIHRLNYKKSIRTYILGVIDGKGIGIPLEIEIRNGTGRVLIDVGDIILEKDVQSTARTAFALADVKSKGSLAEKDASIRIVNPFNKPISISGMSSGAIMTIGLISLGKNQTLRTGVIVTGTISGDGSIGQVSYIKQKAEAAKELNASIMLVPDGQKMSIHGIELIEISNIEEVMEYMLER
ncbi:MAG: S16 family serine protease [Candidatus Hydrothermarchaeaceae archaeon]